MGGYALEQLNQIAQLAVSLMTLIGAPIAVYLFFRDRSIERQDRINEVYRRSSDRYAGFLGLMLSQDGLCPARRSAFSWNRDG